MIVFQPKIHLVPAKIIQWVHFLVNIFQTTSLFQFTHRCTEKCHQKSCREELHFGLCVFFSNSTRELNGFILTEIFFILILTWNHIIFFQQTTWDKTISSLATHYKKINPSFLSISNSKFYHKKKTRSLKQMTLDNAHFEQSHNNLFSIFDTKVCLLSWNLELIS